MWVAPCPLHSLRSHSCWWKNTSRRISYIMSPAPTIAVANWQQGVPYLPQEDERWLEAVKLEEPTLEDPCDSSGAMRLGDVRDYQIGNLMTIGTCSSRPSLLAQSFPGGLVVPRHRIIPLCFRQIRLCSRKTGQGVQQQQHQPRHRRKWIAELPWILGLAAHSQLAGELRHQMVFISSS